MLLSSLVRHRPIAPLYHYRHLHNAPVIRASAVCTAGSYATIRNRKRKKRSVSKNAMQKKEDSNGNMDNASEENSTMLRDVWNDGHGGVSWDAVSSAEAQGETKEKLETSLMDNDDDYWSVSKYKSVETEEEVVDESIEDVIRPFDDVEKARLEKQIVEGMSGEEKDEMQTPESMYYADSYKGNLLSLQNVLDIMEESRAMDMTVIDMRRKCGFCHYKVFVTGQNMRHMHVMAMRVVKNLRRRNIRGLNPMIEGEGSDVWMLVDCGNIVLNVFSPEGRAYYDLERKWAFTNHRIDEQGALILSEEEDLMEMDEYKLAKRKTEKRKKNKKRATKKSSQASNVEDDEDEY